MLFYFGWDVMYKFNSRSISHNHGVLDQGKKGSDRVDHETNVIQIAERFWMVVRSAESRWPLELLSSL